ncbi:hypothetical protein, partial [Vagococcus allomyrinae]|uniref:hypothetical protein n=1 Tax=Vagococcus allomyrinae TaxID=2794353 RepID=UPI001AE85EA6
KMTVARQCFNKNKQRNKDTKISFLIFASLLSWLRLMGQPLSFWRKRLIVSPSLFLIKGD